MKTSCAIAALGALCAAAGLTVPAARAETTLNALFMSQAAYSEEDIRAMTDEFVAGHPDVSVNLEFVPYEALHDKIVLSQGAGSGGYDVVLFDVIWPAEFSQFGLLQDVTDRIPESYQEGVLPGAWTTVEYEGRRYGLPWILDTKYLFYNEEMLKAAGFDAPPKSWEELLQQAQAIKDQGLVEFPIVWSWAQAEAVICDYTTLLAAFGGEFLDADGQPAFHTGAGLQALQYMTGSIESGLSNPNSAEYLEEDVRRVFSSGQAAFALNWAYMYNLANDPAESQVAGKVRVAPAPGAEGVSEVSAVNGSMGLGVTSTSANADLAWEYVLHLTSQPVQNRYSRLSLPIWASSYGDPEVRKDQEELVDAAQVSLAAMYPRPTVPNYVEMSTILQQAIQQALLGQAGAEEALSDAAAQAARLR